MFRVIWNPAVCSSAPFPTAQRYGPAICICIRSWEMHKCKKAAHRVWVWCWIVIILCVCVRFFGVCHCSRLRSLSACHQRPAHKKWEWDIMQRHVFGLSRTVGVCVYVRLRYGPAICIYIRSWEMHKCKKAAHRVWVCMCGCFILCVCEEEKNCCVYVRLRYGPVICIYIYIKIEKPSVQKGGTQGMRACK